MKIIVEGNYIETENINFIGKIEESYGLHSIKYYFNIIMINNINIEISTKNIFSNTRDCFNSDKLAQAKQNIEELRDKLFEIWCANQSCIPNLKLKEINNIEE